MSIQDEVDRLIDERPGKMLLNPDYDEEAVPVHDRVHRSAGTTASYVLDAGGERVIVNTGMGFEAPHHKELFDRLDLGPTSWIVTTQGHVDHVGGVARFREPGTRYVAEHRSGRFVYAAAVRSSRADAGRNTTEAHTMGDAGDRSRRQ